MTNESQLTPEVPSVAPRKHRRGMSGTRLPRERQRVPRGVIRQAREDIRSEKILPLGETGAVQFGHRDSKADRVLAMRPCEHFRDHAVGQSVELVGLRAAAGKSTQDGDPGRGEGAAGPPGDGARPALQGMREVRRKHRPLAHQ